MNALWVPRIRGILLLFDHESGGLGRWLDNGWVVGWGMVGDPQEVVLEVICLMTIPPPYAG
jgi:hypothetical protein